MVNLSIFSQNPAIVDTTQMVLSQEFGTEVEITVLTDLDEIQVHLYYEMPQFSLFDLDDQALQARTLIRELTSDPWLISMGIFGVSSHADESEERIDGVFSIFPPAQIAGLLPSMLRILSSNEQFMVQSDLIQQLGRKGQFSIENRPEVLEAYSELLASTLYNSNHIDMQAKYGTKFSLVEMLMNAVEHGNCSISYAEKNAWLESGKDMVSLIREKCKDPLIAQKRVYLEYEIGETETRFTIKDEGDGFDTSTLPDPDDPMAILDLHGRGVFMTRNYVKELRYNDTGNQVSLVIEHLENKDRKIPIGLQNSKVLQFAPGDIVSEEGDESNTLYYIVGGEYEVVVNGRVITELNNTSIFLGEMAFLLGNRRTATVRAKTEGKLVEIRAREWMEAVQNYPYYGIFLSRLLAKKLDQQSQAKISSD